MCTGSLSTLVYWKPDRITTPSQTWSCTMYTTGSEEYFFRVLSIENEVYPSTWGSVGKYAVIAVIADNWCLCVILCICVCAPVWTWVSVGIFHCRCGNCLQLMLMYVLYDVPTLKRAHVAAIADFCVRANCWILCLFATDLEEGMRPEQVPWGFNFPHNKPRL